MMSEDTDTHRSLSSVSTVSASSDQKEYFFKVLVIGDACVGKTSYIERYVYGAAFKESYKTTIGVDFAIKDIQWSEREVVRLQV
jgi:GTPase SAR1 family protein